MEEILSKKSRELSTSRSDLSYDTNNPPSPQLFESENETTNDTTMYYSPCGGDTYEDFHSSRPTRHSSNSKLY